MANVRVMQAQLCEPVFVTDSPQEPCVVPAFQMRKWRFREDQSWPRATHLVSGAVEFDLEFDPGPWGGPREGRGGGALRSCGGGARVSGSERGCRVWVHSPGSRGHAPSVGDGVTVCVRSERASMLLCVRAGLCRL